MMRYGIPQYRLPRGILDAELNRILDMGVTLELNAKVTDILAELNEAAGGHAGPGAAASTLPLWPSAPTSAGAPRSLSRIVIMTMRLRMPCWPAWRLT
jgi:hypothetical protein